MVDLGTLGGETDIQRGVFLAAEREEQLEMMEEDSKPVTRGAQG